MIEYPLSSNSFVVILSEISGYERLLSNLRIMDNQTGRVLGMLDDVRGTQGQSRGERWKMLQRLCVTIFKLRKFL